MDADCFAQVVFGLPLSRAFDYEIPSSFSGKVRIGQRVKVPFGRRWKTGYVVGLRQKSALPKKAIKPIQEVLDEKPLLNEKFLELSKRISEYYLCSWGEALEAILPSSFRPRKRTSPKIERSEERKKEEHSREVLFSEEEKVILEDLEAKILSEKQKTFLFFGGSRHRKTALLLQLIQKYLEQGCSTIALFPEITLTEEAFKLFSEKFGDHVCLMHSGLSPLERYALWQSLREGKHKIVIGTRSAIFSPVQQLGLIVLFEEQDTSYKQEETPRYHARHVAHFRSQLEGANIVLESETPSLESYSEALKNHYQLIGLPQEKSLRALPKVSVVDMREEILHQKRKVLFSNYLERRMTETLKTNGQILLFLNRRGFSTFVHCKRCGTVLRCEHCRLSFKYHTSPRRLVCHYCNLEKEAPSICPTCRESYLQYTGAGTEKVESEVHRIFPTARSARLDSDVVTHHEEKRLQEALERGELDLVIGTQLVIRETFPERLPLVGILSADTLLNMPDFRSAERTFSTLNHLVEQAKGNEKGGEVVIQSFSPEHHAILASAMQDYPAFYSQEIRSRKQLGFPPFRYLARVLFIGKKEEAVSEAAHLFKKHLNRMKKKKKISILGPAPALYKPVKKKWQWQLIVKSQQGNLAEILQSVLKRFQKKHTVQLVVDIDPY